LGKEIIVVEPLAGLANAAAARTPAVIGRSGKKAVKRFFEFFTANIRNRNTRDAYHRAIVDFFAWCDDHGFELIDIEPIVVAAYVEYLCTIYSKPTVKQHLAAIRMCFDWLVTGQILPMNPASSVRGPSYVIRRGKTPVVTADEARQLLDSIDTSTAVGLRDRALIGVMVYSFARVSAVVGMRVEDYYQNGKRFWIRLHEKGGKFHEVPAHHNAEAYLDAYVRHAGIAEDTKGPLFRTAAGKTAQLTENAMTRRDALRMIKRRALVYWFSVKWKPRALGLAGWGT
jgi:site-specific recombinase XerD